MPEYIPDNDSLYRRIPQFHYDVRKNKIQSSAFFDREHKISVNWAKYSTHEETLLNHEDFSLGELKAKVPREVNQEVKHRPLHDNYSHSEIIGKQTKAVRRHLAKNCQLIINNF